MPTYTPLQSIELSADTATVVLSGISQSYQDLILRINTQGTINNQEIRVRFNGESAAYYSNTLVYSNASATGSVRNTGQTSGYIGNVSNLSFSPYISHFQNYSNTVTYKSFISRGSASDSYVTNIINLWRGSTGSSTEAINSLTLFISSGNFVAGTTFDLYGISTSPGVTAKAIGGDVVISDGTYWYHAFKTSGVFSPLQALTADVLAVAGGGAAAASKAGGGGAGGVLYSSSQSLTSNTVYTVTVGAGGAGVASGSALRTAPNGSNSQFGSLTAAVGGGGGGNDPDNGGGGGGTGGSGGGGSRNGYSNNKGLGTAGQGNNGGDGNGGGGSYPAGGGGGAGAVGQSPTNPGPGGNGGIGTSTYSSWGSATGTGQNSGGTYYYAGGGGGSTYIASGGYAGGSGGLGGGGAGSGVTNNQNGTSGTANTGGGGGGTDGTGTPYYFGGSGGSGVVIVRYAV